ncbi:MAG: ATP-binding cassette domain-containing protein [Paludibacteraceae bacterium]|nr:ATP-binding cassette domain-containing protein [Paludibacteraceae bacterium]
MIEINHLTKSFDGTVVLDDISTVFESGTTNMIIGQSGSGKTVLMKNVIGLFQPDSGTIIYDGRDLTNMSNKQLMMLRREMGMLFQGSALFDSQTVLENVMYPLEMFSDMSNDEMRERAIFCLRRVDIPERAFTLMPSEISGGMQKRVAIARAISMNPKYLFCDEPNSGLDPKTSLIIDQLIYEITKEFNITTIINSHDMNQIMEIGDHIVFLYHGHLLWQGTNEDIFHADCEELDNLVFASKLYKRIKKSINQK